MKVFSNIKSKIILITIFAVGFILCFTAFSSSFFASADNTQNQTSASLYLPASKLEYTALSSPTETYSDEQVSAIVQSNTSLLISYNDQSSIINYSKIMDVKRFDANSIIFSADADLYKVTLDDPTTYNATENNKITLNHKNGKSVSYFDKNANYLVTAYQDAMQVYEIKDGEVNEISQVQISILDGTNVAINDNNEIFYVSNTGICKTSALSLNTIETISYEKPKRIIANNDFIFCINNSSQIFTLPTSAKAEQTYTLLTDTDIDDRFDLGNLSAPNSISFKDDNLLITDDSTVQEYRVENNSLVFTGFAIAQGKSAYNRVSNKTIDVEKYGNTVAILDESELSVFTVDKSNAYSRNNFKNYKDEIIINNVKPNAFTLGNGTVLLSYAHGTSSSSLRYLTFGQEISNAITLFDGNVIHDITYQSGYYYVLADNGMNTSVYRAKENDFTFEQVIGIAGQQFEHLTVDVYSNVYLSTFTKIIKLSKADNYQTPSTVLDGELISINKMATDLGGGLFVLDSSKIYYLVDNTPQLIEIDAPSNDIKSFALNFIEKEVFFIYDNEEFVCESVNMPNLALTQTQDFSDYVTTGENADIDDLKIYTANESANIYKVEKTLSGFNYVSLCESKNNYVYICTITQTNIYNQSVSLYALASNDHIALIDVLDAKDVTEITLNKTQAPQTAFVATDVSGYYFPIITNSSDYLLTVENQAIRLEKRTEIQPKTLITFLNQEFYFASFIIDGVTHTGYIPKAFTTEVLSQDFTWPNSYTEKVSKTMLYADKDLTTTLIELENNQTVTIYQVDGNVAYVSVYDADGNAIVGYISTSAIKNDANTAVRNILIILAVAACVCGTVTFFITRKKKD